MRPIHCDAQTVATHAPTSQPLMWGPKTGSNKAQNMANIVRELLVFFVFNIIIEVFGGFNYSQMANFDSWTYCNTFWMISATSKNSTKSGPSDPVFVTATFQNRQGNLWAHP